MDEEDDESDDMGDMQDVDVDMDMDVDSVDNVEDTHDSTDDADDSGDQTQSEMNDRAEVDTLDHADDSKDRFSLEDLDTFAEQDIEADEELGDLLSRSYDFGSIKSDKTKWVLESSDGTTNLPLFSLHLIIYR